MNDAGYSIYSTRLSLHFGSKRAKTDQNHGQKVQRAVVKQKGMKSQKEMMMQLHRIMKLRINKYKSVFPDIITYH